MYGEEHGPCLRALALGANPRLYHPAEFIHYQGQSYRRRAGMWVCLLRAKITLVLTYLTVRQRRLVTSLYRLRPLIRISAFSLAGVLNRAELGSKRPNGERFGRNAVSGEIGGSQSYQSTRAVTPLRIDCSHTGHCICPNCCANDQSQPLGSYCTVQMITEKCR